tara:strand:- start:3942 stop:4187 length:246 start_codon:yes stop_codon:yes gene_type:complete
MEATTFWSIIIFIGGISFAIWDYNRGRKRYYQWHREQQINAIQERLNERYEMRKATNGIVRANGVGGRHMTTIPEIKDNFK